MTEPLVWVLWIVNSDDKPAMGYLYEAIYSAKKKCWGYFKEKGLRCNIS